MDKRVLSNIEERVERENMHITLRHRLIDEVVYDIADYLVTHGVEQKEFNEFLLKLQAAFKAFREYESRHKYQETEEWNNKALAAEREAEERAR